MPAHRRKSGNDEMAGWFRCVEIAVNCDQQFPNSGNYDLLSFNILSRCPAVKSEIRSLRASLEKFLRLLLDWRNVRNF